MSTGELWCPLWGSVVCMDHTPARQSGRSRWSPRLPLELSEAPSLATAALMLAECRIPVFPCTSGAKQPLTVHGFYDASADLGTVRNWWQRLPDANVGIPTGAASGVDVVDVDIHLSGNGFAAFERARSAGLVDGWAWLVRTPSGGVHAYFLRRRGGEQRSWQVPGQHVDFRGDGGYIIAPPSRVDLDGHTAAYELIAIAQHRARPVDADALRRFLDLPRPVLPPAGLPALASRPDKLAAWVASRPEGARNQGLFWAACRMVEDGYRFDAAASLLAEAAQRAGLPEHEVMTTIRSAYRIATRPGPAPTARPTPAAEAVAL
jgi:Bifunctional DNA primase/polymerase, N-terminal